MTGPVQVAIYALQTDDRLYYCDLGRSSSQNSWQESFTYDGNNYDQLVRVNVLQPIENGEVVMTMTHAPPQLICTTDWPVDSPTLVGTFPGDILPGLVSISVIGLELELRSFAQIHSD
jgi:hypothetical protein